MPTEHKTCLDKLILHNNLILTSTLHTQLNIKLAYLKVDTLQQNTNLLCSNLLLIAIPESKQNHNPQTCFLDLNYALEHSAYCE